MKGWGAGAPGFGGLKLGVGGQGVGSPKGWGTRRGGGTNPETGCGCELWGPKWVRTQTQKEGACRVGAGKGGGLKGKISRLFFLLPPPMFILFFSLWGSSRVFIPLSWGSSRGILVVFWLVGTSNVHVFALRLSCGSPGGRFERTHGSVFSVSRPHHSTTTTTTNNDDNNNNTTTQVNNTKTTPHKTTKNNTTQLALTLVNKSENQNWPKVVLA